MEEKTDLPKEVVEKFDEINAVQDEVEEADATLYDSRKADEGLNADGTIVEEEPEEEIAEPEPVEEEEPEPEEESDDSTQEVEEIALPDRLLQAARRNKMSDEDILALPDDRRESILSGIADTSDSFSEELGKQGRELRELRVKPSEPKKPDELKFDKEDYDEDKLGKVAESVNAIRQDLESFKQNEANRQSEIIDRTADTFFDNKAEGYTELGDSKKLSTSALVIRQSIFEQAADITRGAQARGQNVGLGAALDMAFSLYERDNIKEKVRTDIVEKAKKRSSQRTSRPTRRKTNETFATPTAKAEDEVKKWHKERGLTIPEDED